MRSKTQRRKVLFLNQCVLFSSLKQQNIINSSYTSVIDDFLIEPGAFPGDMESDDSDTESEKSGEENEELEKELTECISKLRESVLKKDFPSMLAGLKTFDDKFLKRVK